jgi:hypothetical protein
MTKAVFMSLPKARTEDIVVQESSGELLIYDLTTKRALALNEPAKAVYRACDGKTSIEEIVSRANLTTDAVYLAIDKLNTENLIENGYRSPLAGLSRREVMKRVGLSSLAAIPVIMAIDTPAAAQTGSCNGTGTTLTTTLFGGGLICAVPGDCAVNSTPFAVGFCCSGMAHDGPIGACGPTSGRNTCLCD